MSAKYTLAPLTANGPLKIAVVGPNKAGKTALIRHFLNHAHEVLVEPREPPHPSRPGHPILARLAASRLAFILARTVRLAFSFIRVLQKQAPTCVQHDILPAPDAHPLTFLDARGAIGLHAMYDDAASTDVVLYVTRLDHSRADRHDKNMFAEIVHVFGNEVLDRMIIVLTRGYALPPLNLTYREFVRGRSDLLTGFVRLVWPPVVVRPQSNESRYENEDSQDEKDVENAPLVSGGAIVNSSAQKFDLEEITFMSGIRRDIRLYPRTQTQEQGELHPTVRSVVAALVNDNDTDEGSVSAIPENFLDPLFEAGVHPDDKRTFKDPATPPFVVVELSHACPTNSNEEKLLPDGTPWFSNLVATIAEVSEDAPRKTAERIARKEEETSQPPLNFSSRFREMLRSVSRDAIRLFLIQTVLALLIWQVVVAIEDARERREKAVEKDESNVLLELSDEEFDELTRPDPGSGGMAEIIIDPGDEDEIDLEESEEEFFRDAKSKRRRKKKREREKAEKEPIPLPEMPVPRGPHPVPGLEDEIGGENSADSTTENKSRRSPDEEKTISKGTTTNEPMEKQKDSSTEEQPRPPEDSAKTGPVPESVPELEPERPSEENKPN